MAMKHKRPAVSELVSADDVLRWVEKIEHERDNFQTWSEGHAVHHVFSRVRSGISVDGYRRDDGQRAIRYRAVKNGKSETIRFYSDDPWFLWEWLDGIGVIEHFENGSMAKIEAES